jgi:transcriptional regulator with XRE-family HTH domain
MVTRLLDRVRHEREQRGLTQEAFAEQAGLQYKHYQAVEAGRKMNFTMATFEKMAKGLGLEPWELLVPADLARVVAEAQAKYGRSPQPRSRKNK